jgi:TonB family protein
MNTQHGISSWLIRHAAASAPPSLRERLEEEWLADLQARRGNVSKLMFGVGCCWAAQTIAREFPVGAIGAAATGGSATIVAYGSHAPQRWSRHPGAMLVIIVFHAVVIYTFANLFNHAGHDPVITPVKARFLDVKPEKNAPLPRPIVKFTGTPIEPLVINDRFAFPTDPQSITVPTGGPDIGGGGTTGESVIVPGGPGAGFPSAEDHYPAPAKWLGEQGSAAVRVCVDASGKLTGLPTVAQSTGSPRLDAGAIQLAEAGSGHYRPARKDGRPVSSCFAFRVTFRLQ